MNAIPLKVKYSYQKRASSPRRHTMFLSFVVAGLVACGGSESTENTIGNQGRFDASEESRPPDAAEKNDPKELELPITVMLGSAANVGKVSICQDGHMSFVLENTEKGDCSSTGNGVTPYITFVAEGNLVGGMEVHSGEIVGVDGKLAPLEFTSTSHGFLVKDVETKLTNRVSVLATDAEVTVTTTDRDFKFSYSENGLTLTAFQ